MSPHLLAGVAVFGGLGLALCLLALTIRGHVPAPRPGRSTQWRRAARSRLSVASAAGLAVLVLTRWPVAAGAVAGMVAAWPGLFGGAAAERAAIARLEALATWTESLRDTIAGAVGLEQAIPATVEAAHPQIRGALARLRGRLEARQPLPHALRRLAADLADPSADLVVAALLLNAELRGPGLRATLTALAASAREELDMRRRVEARRRGIRRGVAIVVAVTAGFLSVLVTFNRDYLNPYNGPAGQTALVVVVAVFASGFALLRRLAAFDVPDRVLAAPSGGHARPEAGIR